MARAINWLLSPLPVFKMFQSAFLLLVVIFFLDGRDQWLPYKIIFGLCLVMIVADFLSLVLHYFEVPLSSKQLPWIKMELLFNVLSALACVGCVVVLSYDWFQLNRGDTRHHLRAAPRTIGESGWLRRVAIVIGCLLVACFLFVITIVRVKRSGIQ